MLFKKLNNLRTFSENRAKVPVTKLEKVSVCKNERNIIIKEFKCAKKN